MASWIVLDIIGLGLFNLAAGVTFIFVALIGVYGILKFLGCLRPCYQCKKCTYGLGRIAALYFGKRSLKDYKYNYGLAVAIFFYLLIGPFPALILLWSSAQGFAVIEIAVLAALMLISAYSASTWRLNRSK